jgi:hypothetical protein
VKVLSLENNTAHIEINGKNLEIKIVNNRILGNSLTLEEKKELDPLLIDFKKNQSIKDTSLNTTNKKSVFKSEFLQRCSTTGDIKGRLTAYSNKIEIKRNGEKIVIWSPEIDSRAWKVINLFIKSPENKTFFSIESSLTTKEISILLSLYSELTVYGMDKILFGPKWDRYTWDKTVDAILEHQIGFEYWDKINTCTFNKNQVKIIYKVKIEKLKKAILKKLDEKAMKSVLNCNVFVEQQIKKMKINELFR